MKKPLRITPEVQIVGADGKTTRDGFNVLQQLIDKVNESVTYPDALASYYPLPQDGSYKLFINTPFAYTVNSVTTIAVSGTCTATWKNGTTALGGTANSVSSSEQTQAHTSANTFAIGDDLVLTISANSSCVGMSFTVSFERDP